MERKAQSAMEFLMTYGWAVLIMLIVIAILFMLGVFNPTTGAPNSCVLPSGFSCYGYSLINGGGLTLDLGQASGGEVLITRIGCSAKESSPMMQTVNTRIQSGHHKNLTGTLFCEKEDGTYPVEDEYYRGTLYLEYTDVRTGILHDITGDIAYHVESGETGTVVTPTPTPTATATPTPTPTPDLGPLYEYGGTLYYYPTGFSGGESPWLRFGAEGNEIQLQEFPLDSATITLTRDEAGGPYTTTTSGGGAFSLDVPAGWYLLRITASGYDTLLTDRWFYIEGTWTEQSMHIYETYPDGNPPGGACGGSDTDCNSRNCRGFLDNREAQICVPKSVNNVCQQCWPCDIDADCNGQYEGGMVCDTSTHLCVEETPGSYWTNYG